MPSHTQISWNFQKMSSDHLKEGVRLKLVKNMKVSFILYVKTQVMSENGFNQSNCWIIWSLIFSDRINAYLEFFFEVVIKRKKSENFLIGFSRLCPATLKIDETLHRCFLIIWGLKQDWGRWKWKIVCLFSPNKQARRFKILVFQNYRITRILSNSWCNGNKFKET